MSKAKEYYNECLKHRRIFIDKAEVDTTDKIIMSGEIKMNHKTLEDVEERINKMWLDTRLIINEPELKELLAELKDLNL